MRDLKSKRKSIRFESDENTLALIDFKAGEDFHPTVVGLNIDESSSGNGVVMLRKQIPDVNTSVKIQVGNLAPMAATCVWIKELDDHIARVGFQFDE